MVDDCGGGVCVSVLPAAPSGLQVLNMVDNNVTLWWRPGFSGHSELTSCNIQVRAENHDLLVCLLAPPPHPLPPLELLPLAPCPAPLQVSRRSGWRWDLPQQEVLVPPHRQVLSPLRSHSNYSVRVSCVNEVGASPFSPWLHFQTPESGEPWEKA